MRAPAVICVTWYADIGARVSQGQVLADIETPELDQQVEQAQSDLATAQGKSGDCTNYGGTLAEAARKKCCFSSGGRSGNQ